MASKKKILDQNRRDAMYWAEEWRIKQRRRRIFTGIGAVIAVVALGFLINYISILGSRMVFSSEEEMREYVQGRFANDMYEDIYIEGDKITLTYYSISHYDKEYAEKWGYEDYGDSVYEDRIVKWDYRRGAIKCDWMSDITIDRDGDLVYYHQKFVKTDEPAPVPFDPSTLENYNPEGEEAPPAEEPDFDDPATQEEQEAAEEQQESLEGTEEAAEDAGILPEGETDAV